MAHEDADIRTSRADFICVRVTRMNGVDLSRFEFDYDTTWSCFFTDANLRIYSRYGGRDDQNSDGRLSRGSLLQTMREVVQAHAQARGRASKEPSASRPAAEPPAAKPAAEAPLAADSSTNAQAGPLRHGVTPEHLPLLKANHTGCIHCHQVQEYRLLQDFHDGVFRRESLFGYPLPENLGLAIDREHGHRVLRVAAGTPAALAGIQPGDVIIEADGAPVRSEQDLRWSLHHAREAAPVKLSVNRGQPAARHEALLKLPAGWKQTDLSWRKSLRSVPLNLGCLAYDLGREERRKAGHSEDQLAIRIISLRGEKGLAQSLGLKLDDVLVRVGKQSAKRTLDELKSDLLRMYAPGDPVEAAVLRDGVRVELKGMMPEWHTAANSVP